jgi:predicted ArsR family transcriptional regulator
MFLQQLPHKPYCTNDFADGLKIRPKAMAIAHRYIQLNPPGILSFMLFDLDFAESAWTFERCDLPHPTFIVINRANGHCHYIYALLAPVVFGHGHEKPRRYFLAIEHTYRVTLGADPGYSGFITKNPFHHHWLVVSTPLAKYDLDALAERATLQSPPKKREQQAGQGRNVTLFDSLRTWAYKARRKYDDYGEWLKACLAMAAQMNVFDRPLDYPEVKSIAKSVARWTWQHITPQAFSQIQRERNKRGRLSAAAKAEDKRASARLMRAQGMTLREIAQALGVSKDAVAKWLNN